MLFQEEDAPVLKKWIVKRLENTSDADGDVLADYVLALLRHDGDLNTVRALCEAEIPDFLQEGSSIFIQDVFDAVLSRSYLPGARQPLGRQPAQPHAFANPPTGPASFNEHNLLGNAAGAALGAPLGPSSGSRKRTYQDRGDGDSQDKGSGFSSIGIMDGDQNGRMYKQPRRSGPSGPGNFDDRAGYMAPGTGGRGRGSAMHQQPGHPSMPMPMSMHQNQLSTGFPQFDSNDPLSAILAMQAMGLPMPPFPGFPQPSSTNVHNSRHGSNFPKKQRCKDYDTKGFCARGNCIYEHGQDSIYVPSAVPTDEYDPANATLMTGIESNHGATPSSFNNLNTFNGSDRGRGRGRGHRGDRGDRGGPHNRGRRGGRAEFSSDRPNLDKSKTTIVVENVPEEKFSEDAIKEFFSQFGDITEVLMRPYKRLAIVKYGDWNAANAAYKSPKVIFDNRFVKVYWHTDAQSLPQAPGVSEGAHNENEAGPVPARTTSEPQIDIEEFALKQLEVQKAHEEKIKKKQEMEAARRELEKRQEELLKSQAEEKRKLMERIAAKSKTSESAQNGAPAASKPVSQTEALKAQLAALEAEAQSLGLDPSAAEEPWSGRGRGRGRGYRARGTFAPRGYRGGYRGRGGAASAGGANAYKLDNRPRKVALTGIDFSNADKDESLRQYLLGVGEYADIETTEGKTSITFKDRFTAEKFMYGVPNGEIPSVGKVEMAWVQQPLAPIPFPKTAGLEGGHEHKDLDTPMDEGDAMASDSIESQHNSQARNKHQMNNLDYDVGGEWDDI